MPRLHFINFVRTMVVTSVFFLSPLYLMGLGFDGLAIGLVMSLFAAAPIVFSFPTGWINDRLSMTKVIFGGLMVMAAMFVLTVFVRSVPGMAAIFLFLGIANNILNVSINSLYYKDETEANPNRKYGIFVFWLSLGPPVGLLAGSLLARFSDFRALLLVFAAVTVLTSLALRGLDHEKFAAVSIRDYRFSVFNRKTLVFSILLFVLALHWGTEGTVYAPFLRDRFGLDDSGVAMYISGAYLALAMSALMISRLRFDPRLNRRLFLIGMALSGFGLIMMVRQGLRASFIFRFIHEGGDGLMGALVVLYISGLFEKRTIGGSAGILTALQTSGHIAGTMAFSWLGYRAGLHVPMLVAGGLLVANAAFSLVALPRN